jgi:hypothetical protein
MGYNRERGFMKSAGMRWSEKMLMREKLKPVQSSADRIGMTAVETMLLGTIAATVAVMAAATIAS